MLFSDNTVRMGADTGSSRWSPHFASLSTGNPPASTLKAVLGGKAGGSFDRRPDGAQTVRTATERNLPPVMLQGKLVEVLGREGRRGSPGEMMVESCPSRQRRPPCKTNKGKSDEAADAAALTYLLTYCGKRPRLM